MINHRANATLGGVGLECQDEDSLEPKLACNSKQLRPSVSSL
ncbi:hypothetical protein SPLC1_S520040 [Arthrospira platensis C1]|nr:hypothetical protein SPLC1_S520040 [Arthrospira platensis C1]